MFGAHFVAHTTAMDLSPRLRPNLQEGSDPDGSARSVQLTRFAIHPDRRSELLSVAHAKGCPPAPISPNGTLLVELEDGDWLAISISAREMPVEDFAYLDLAEGILGDEAGVLVAVAPCEPGNLDAPGRDDCPEGR